MSEPNSYLRNDDCGIADKKSAEARGPRSCVGCVNPAALMTMHDILQEAEMFRRPPALWHTNTKVVIDPFFNSALLLVYTSEFEIKTEEEECAFEFAANLADDVQIDRILGEPVLCITFTVKDYYIIREM